MEERQGSKPVEREIKNIYTVVNVNSHIEIRPKPTDQNPN
jgi:hypothetical protein